MLTVYGIETLHNKVVTLLYLLVATVLTVYGIETIDKLRQSSMSSLSLQQCLPFTVLKLHEYLYLLRNDVLQQCLPFTVLKPHLLILIF